MTTAIYPGSFDPPTLGHLDIIRRSAGIFDELVVCVMNNGSKSQSLFTCAERSALLRKITDGIQNVRIETYGGLLADYIRNFDSPVVIRGLRAVTDFEYELQMAQTNHIIAPDIDTIFLTTNLNYAYLSSSVVKEVARYGGDISKFVTPQVRDRVLDKYNITT